MSRASGPVVVIGCGRLGAYVAGELSRAGREVVVLDRRAEAFEALPAGFSGFTVEGDAGEYDALERAGLAKAGSVLACTANDNVNILAAQVAARVHGVPRVLARVFDTDRQELCDRLGIRTISPSEVLGVMFVRFLAEPDASDGPEGSDTSGGAA